MRRAFTATLGALAAAGIYFAVYGIARLITTPPSDYDQDAVTRPEDLAPGGLETALLVFGAGLILTRVSVICRWIHSSAAAKRAHQAQRIRLRFEASFLQHYGMPARPAARPRLDMT